MGMTDIIEINFS